MVCMHVSAKNVRVKKKSMFPSLTQDNQAVFWGFVPLVEEG